MAHIVMGTGMDALIKLSEGLQILGVDIDEIAKTCVNAANPTLEAIYRGAIASAVPGGTAGSVATKEATKNYLGVFSVVRPVGYKAGDENRTRYGMIAAMFNYGVSAHEIHFKSKNKFGLDKWYSKRYGAMHPGITATGWFAKAASAAEGPVSEIVKAKFEEEVKRLAE